MLFQISLPHYTSTKFLSEAVDRYLNFLLLKQTYTDQFLTPCYDFDIVWHTHQVCHSNNFRFMFISPIPFFNAFTAALLRSPLLCFSPKSVFSFLTSLTSSMCYERQKECDPNARTYLGTNVLSTDLYFKLGLA